MNLFPDLKSEIDEELSEESVRISVGLNGRAAEAFRVLHESLGGQSVLSRNALGARILTRVLIEDEPRKQRRSSKTESAPYKGEPTDIKEDDL
jgi:hypothetical protein